MSGLETLFFELIRVAIGTQDHLSRLPSEAEWKELFEMAVKQSLIGVCFAAMQRLGADSDEGYSRIGMSEELFFDWMGMVAQINMRNEVISEAVGKVKGHFEIEGFDMVLLKGQGNLCNYPDPICMMRTSGDIDAWIMPKGFEAMSLKERMKNDEFVLRHFWKKNPSIRHCYIHIHEHLFEDIDVEVHYRPSFFNSPWRNHRFQQWMMKEAPSQLANFVRLPGCKNVEVAIPTKAFNLIYQMNHLYRHIFDDGLGLRQVLDYYFLQQNLSDNDIQAFQEDVEKLGMRRFASALMYVMQEVFGLCQEKMLVAPDKKTGEFLLKEIMQAGNFGHYDERKKVTKHENGVQRFIRRQKRNMRFFSQYTEEVLCVPLFRVYQEYWRVKMNIKCK